MSLGRKQPFVSLFIFALLVFAPSFVHAQAPEDKSASSDSLVRPCAMPAHAKPGRKDKTKRKPSTAPDETAFACLEAKDSPLNIQQFFQSYVRAQAWRFGEEKIIADGWIFARYLDKDELLQFAKEGPLAGHVTWTEGKAVVQVATRELDDGYTRAEISAHVQGFGQNVDRFAPARDTWHLDSSGLLEKNLIAALEDHFKSLHSTPPAQSTTASQPRPSSRFPEQACHARVQALYSLKQLPHPYGFAGHLVSRQVRRNRQAQLRGAPNAFRRD